MSSSMRPVQWWSNSRRSSRRALLGGVVLVLSLGATSYVVWTTPSISPATGVSAAVKVLNAQAELADERDQLANQVAQLKAQIEDKNSKLADSSAKLASTQSNLSTANGSVSSLQAQIAQLQAKLATASKSKSKVTSSTGTSPAAAITAPTKQQLLDPASPYFGLYTEQAPFNWATFDSTASKIGAEPSIVGYFAGWDQTFRADAVTRAWSRNTLPVMTWESRPINDGNDVVDSPAYSLPKIIAGGFDDYLHQYAKAIVATGLPMGIRLDHEMNATWYPWSEDDGHGNSINGNSPGDYVKMWQHVHDIFQAEGANQYVIWIWAPNRVDNLTSSHKALAYTKSLYPGDADVDWVGMSGYLRPPFTSGQTFSFDETFGATLTQLRAVTNKPILLAEVGASETDGHKPAWISNFFSGLADPANDDIVGFAWFNLAVTTYVQGSLATNDWRIDSRSDTLAAFQAGLLAPGSRFHLTVPQ